MRLARQVLAHAIGERGERTGHHDPPRPPRVITKIHDACKIEDDAIFVDVDRQLNDAPLPRPPASGSRGLP